jgi:hypothetical protein
MEGYVTDNDIGRTEKRYLEDKPAGSLGHRIDTVACCGHAKDMPVPVSAVLHFRDGKRDP